jgi:hypothetical protein
MLNGTGWSRKYFTVSNRARPSFTSSIRFWIMHVRRGSPISRSAGPFKLNSLITSRRSLETSKSGAGGIQYLDIQYHRPVTG